MSALSVSAPFIRRPIATSLLGVAVLLGGLLGYWLLPVSSLPQVDFPTIQVTTQLPGANPDTIAALVTAPLERQFGQIPSLDDDDVAELVRDQPGHAAIRSQPRHRRRRAGRAGRDQRCAFDPAAEPAVSADLFEGQSGRRADRDARADVATSISLRQLERSRGYAAGAAARRGDRRRPRDGAGRHQARGAHPGRPGAARGLRDLAGGRARRHRRRQRVRPEGLARRRAAILHDRRERSDRAPPRPTHASSSPIATARR